MSTPHTSRNSLDDVDACRSFDNSALMRGWDKTLTRVDMAELMEMVAENERMLLLQGGVEAGPKRDKRRCMIGTKGLMANGPYPNSIKHS